GLQQLYVRDRVIGKTEMVSRTSSGSPGGDAEVIGEYPFTRSLQGLGVHDPRRPSNTNHYAMISPDGRYVAFDTEAALVPDDTNNRQDTYVRDRRTGRTTRISISSSGA